MHALAVLGSPREPGIVPPLQGIHPRRVAAALVRVGAERQGLEATETPMVIRDVGVGRRAPACLALALGPEPTGVVSVNWIEFRTIGHDVHREIAMAHQGHPHGRTGRVVLEKTGITSDGDPHRR